MSPAQKPHQPSRDKNPADEHDETIQTVAKLVSRGIALRDSENNRGKHTKQYRRIEV
jgi:hypothetical protein